LVALTRTGLSSVTLAASASDASRAVQQQKNARQAKRRVRA
jgi:hypothetical protein